MRSWRRFRGWLLAADLVWAVVALALALVLRQSGWAAYPQQAANWWPVLVIVLLTWALLFSSLELDGFGAGWRRSTIVSQCLIGVCALMLVVFAGGYAGRVLRSRLALGYFAALFSAGVIAIRFLAARRVRRSHQRGHTARTLVLGDGPLAQETVRRVNRHPELGWAVIGYLSLQQDTTLTPASHALRTLDVIEFAKSQKLDQVVVAMEEPLIQEIQTLLDQLRDLGLTIIQVPAHFELYSCRPHLLDLDGIPVICFERAAPPLLGLAAKRALDYLGACAGLIVTFPLWATLAILARVQRGRAFISVRRVGCRGREFAMWRLPWAETDPDHPFCRFGLSELPQLWNVLRGDMSLVGPRPEAPEVVKHYSDWQRRRLDVIPGITGLAQVHGWRGKHREHERYSFDLEYVVRWSLWRDVAILLQTASTLYRRQSLAARASLAPVAAIPKDEVPC